MSILIKPVVTEKATADSELNNRYTFLVNVKANKVEIKKTIEATYGVSVEKVRTRVVNGFDAITTDKPEKSLLVPKKRSGGRNNQGKMTMRYIGGGHKKRYRIIDFKRDRKDAAAEVKSIQYDPNRTAFIALVEYADGEKRYIIAQNGLKVGQSVVSGEKVAPEIGNAMPLSGIPLGTIISCVELRPGQGAVMARSAGAFAQLMARDGKYATIKLPSGETRIVMADCLATVGAVSTLLITQWVVEKVNLLEVIQDQETEYLLKDTVLDLRRKRVISISLNVERNKIWQDH